MIKIEWNTRNESEHATDYIKRCLHNASWDWFLSFGFFLGVMAATALFKFLGT